MSTLLTRYCSEIVVMPNVIVCKHPWTWLWATNYSTTLSHDLCIVQSHWSEIHTIIYSGSVSACYTEYDRPISYGVLCAHAPVRQGLLLFIRLSSYQSVLCSMCDFWWVYGLNLDLFFYIQNCRSGFHWAGWKSILCCSWGITQAVRTGSWCVVSWSDTLCFA